MPSRKLQKDLLSPFSFPLKSMKELKDWEPSKDRFNISNIPLQSRQKDKSRSRLIITHDMAGGYKEDLYVQGNDYKEVYNCQYWHLSDMFIYFSHERVTIPPVNWINACHRNGVQCLGTFIVEGNSIHELEALLHGPPFEKTDDDPNRLWSPFYADKLVDIAKHYEFDGWLINIECGFFGFPTAPQFKASELAKFVGYLTEKMHQEIPGSKIIWYDSMTKDGDIHWQNRLNELNESFFLNSDGIFLNYWWNKDYLAQSRAHAESHGRSALDIYVGTDVWGRHTYGGGEFRSYRGVKAAADKSLSNALFATAWTYEHFNKVDFEKIDRLFWCGGNFDEYPPLSFTNNDLYPSDSSEDSDDELIEKHKKGISDTLNTYPVPSSNWFVTNFDKGFGTRFYYRGKELLSQPWSHLSHQSILPNLNYRQPTLYPEEKNIVLKSSLREDQGAFLGGTSLVITGQQLVHCETYDLEIEAKIPLYSLHLDASEGCQIRYIYRTSLEDDDLILACEFQLEAIHPTKATDFLNAWTSNPNEDGIRATVVSSTESRCFVLSTLTEQRDDWQIKSVVIPKVSKGCRLWIRRLEVDVLVATANLAGVRSRTIASLGYLSLVPTVSGQERTTGRLGHLEWQEVKTVQDSEGFWFFGTLNWLDSRKTRDEWKETEYYMVSYELQGESRVFIGTAFCNQYRVSGLHCKDISKVYHVVVEAVTREGWVASEAKIPLI